MSNRPLWIARGIFIVNDKRLAGYYEGITYDTVEKMFFFGSEHKIVKVDHLGNINSIFFLEGYKESQSQQSR